MRRGFPAARGTQSCLVGGAPPGLPVPFGPATYRDHLRVCVSGIAAGKDGAFPPTKVHYTGEVGIPGGIDNTEMADIIREG